MCFRPAEITMNKCPQCGAACKPNATECPECGAAIDIVKIDVEAQQARFAKEAEANAVGTSANGPAPAAPPAPGAPAAPPAPRQ